MFIDTSTECAICLEPLDDDSTTITSEERKFPAQVSAQVQAQAQAPSVPVPVPVVITLKCGHKWHYACIVQQLETAKPSSTKRLLFTGCQCAKCGVICDDHPQLQNNLSIQRTTNNGVLRQKVDDLLREQVAMDAPEAWKRASNNSNSNSNSNNNNININININSNQEQAIMLDHARRKYAFYLCRHCKEPYFGGTVECSDSLHNDDNDSSIPQGGDNNERLCVACAPQSQLVCQNPLEHRGHLVWKCRYCCQPSTHLCYGNVHFCNDCHDRNSARVRRQQQQQQHQKHQYQQNSTVIIPPALKAIPCLGNACPFPKKKCDISSSSNSSNNNNSNSTQRRSLNMQFHKNGSSSECEQVYGCAWCQSSAEHQQGQQEQEAEAGSRNLLDNSSGQNGLHGWRQLNPRISWAVEPIELPIATTTSSNGNGNGLDENPNANNMIRTNFVSSFLPCVMEQTVDLWRFRNNDNDNANENNTRHRIEVSARYMGRTDCPSMFRLEAILTGQNQQYQHPNNNQNNNQNRRLRPLLQQHMASRNLEAPPDYWERVRLILEDVDVSLPQARYLTVAVIGKDGRFWQGTFGSKVADISVRILGTPQALTQNGWKRQITSSPDHDGDNDHRDTVQIPLLVRGRQNNNNNNNDINHQDRRNHGGNGERQQQQRQPQRNNIVVLRDGVLPMLCLAFLAWLLQD